MPDAKERGGSNLPAHDSTLQVCEIFKSLQGESSWTGHLCLFIRLAGCDLRCSWCDTRYAAEERGATMAIDAILAEARQAGVKLAVITGGEPLLQAATPLLAIRLVEGGFTVLVETNGAHDISVLPPPIIRIMDLKTPSSGMSKRMDWQNLERLRPQDEVKFVIADRFDYEWAREVMREYRLHERCRVLMSAVLGRIEPATLADMIVQDDMPVRFQLQMHKIIWPQRLRGA